MRKNIAGQSFGRLTAISPTTKRASDGGVIWRCQCECGNICFVRAASLNAGQASCGCLIRDNCRTLGKDGERRKIHGMSGTRLYRIWDNMKARCYRPSHNSYKNYGARGITVCKEWRESFKLFAEWALNNGYEEHLTIDRIDNNKGYSPDNCRWATMAEQSRNKRKKSRLQAVDSALHKVTE